MAISYFDEIFFSKYLKTEDEVLDVCHKHVVTIIDTILIGMFFFVILPAFFYYNNTFFIRDLMPFIFFEIYLFLVYIVLIYRIFDWYNDTWIITDKGIIDLDWQFFQTNIVYIDYSDVKGIELHQESMFDGLLSKGKIQIHALGGSAFILEDAKNPGGIVEFIQGILEAGEKAKKEKEKTLTEKLFSTLRGVVKEYLDKEGIELEGETEEEAETEEEKAVSKTLKKAGTIDLR